MTLAQILNITRPLCGLDVETHALLPPEQTRIVQIGFLMFYPDGQIKRWSHLINPGCPIDPETTKVHGITDEMVREAPPFAGFAANLAMGFAGADYAGQNVRFDLRVVEAEMRRARVAWNYDDAKVIDSGRLEQILEPRTLTDLVRKYLKRERTQAHDALGDVVDAVEVLAAQLEANGHVPRDVDQLHELFWPNRIDPDGKFVWGPDGEAVVNFSKQKGVRLREVDRGFLFWIIRGDFSAGVKQIAGDATKGIFPVKPVTPTGVTDTPEGVDGEVES